MQSLDEKLKKVLKIAFEVVAARSKYMVHASTCSECDYPGAWKLHPHTECVEGITLRALLRDRLTELRFSVSELPPEVVYSLVPGDGPWIV